MALSHLCVIPASALLQLRCFSAKVQRMQYDSMQPQDIVEHEEKKRVNALQQREKLIRDLGVIDQLSRLLSTADTQESSALSNQVMALPRATPHRSELGTEPSLVGQDGGPLQEDQLLCLQDDMSLDWWWGHPW